ncbi:hypothetical protein NN561_012343 [Cricetulus griseus]
MTGWSGPTPFPSLITSCLPSTRFKGLFRAGKSQISFPAQSPGRSAPRRLGGASGSGSRLGRGWSPPILPRWRRGGGKGEGRRAYTGSELSGGLDAGAFFRVSIKQARAAGIAAVHPHTPP